VTGGVVETTYRAEPAEDADRRTVTIYARFVPDEVAS
jgi:hypothetical protein